MAKPKSFIKNIKIDRAQRAHNCQHNSNHRIYKGDLRVGLKVHRNMEYFCVKCALETINRDISILEKRKEEIETNLEDEEQ